MHRRKLASALAIPITIIALGFSSQCSVPAETVATPQGNSVVNVEKANDGIELTKAKLQVLMDSKQRSYDKYKSTMQDTASIQATDVAVSAQAYLDERHEEKISEQQAALDSAIEEAEAQQATLAKEAEIQRQKEQEMAQQQAMLDSEIAEEQLCLDAVGNVPNDASGCRSEAKTYMPYTAVTSRDSDQWRLLRGDSCVTDTNTGMMMVGDRYCIAVGSYYATEIGTKLDVVSENGSIVKCIVGDFKADRHTNSSNQYHREDGSVVELIVNYDYFKSSEDVKSKIPGFSGKVVKIVKVD